VVNAVAVLVVSCACAIVLATPVVVLASVGNAARRGLLIKGDSSLEQLARVDTIVVDKTGTLTLGTLQVTDVVAFNGLAERDFLRVVAGVESRSEHPLAKAILRAAAERDLVPPEPEVFTPLPGRGLLGTLDGQRWAVGNRRLLAEHGATLEHSQETHAQALEAEGKTVFFVANGQGVSGLVAVGDALRPGVQAALTELRRLGVRRLLLLTGDNERVAAAVAKELGLEAHANLLPEDKIAAVKALQAEGAVV
jgi:P-type Cu+ transporter